MENENKKIDETGKSLTKIKESFEDKIEIIYRATTDGFSAQNFHSKCDHAKKTLTIIETTDNYIFGGYTEQSWDGNCVYKDDPNAFIFSIDNNIKGTIEPTSCEEAFYCYPIYGPTFGAGHDIHISNNSNSSNHSYSQNHSYQTSLSLTGSRKFNTFEIEVFSLI
ncbi:BTB POZ domain-containing KCTD21 [Brachionus plicatilis]|uniref:BTB POZ domain-containing KCTD21 n=1 Tax=Brachionus plicatilis TaxID=10195 RepID=A0A3M7Q1U2_BRAPC|nr:BTB POZ domain-containing KCTD21 [Brachionus plicatilis]